MLTNQNFLPVNQPRFYRLLKVRNLVQNSFISLVFTNPFSSKKNIENEESHNASFFISRKQRKYKKSQKIENDQACMGASNQSLYESCEEIHFFFRYDDIISGKVDLDSLNIDKIEVRLCDQMRMGSMLYM